MDGFFQQLMSHTASQQIGDHKVLLYVLLVFQHKIDVCVDFERVACFLCLAAFYLCVI